MLDFSRMDIEPASKKDGIAKSKEKQAMAKSAAVIESAEFDCDYDNEFDTLGNTLATKIRTLVVSCGNAGGNILSHIVKNNPCENIEYFMTDTDYNALKIKRLKNCKPVLLGAETCKGFGAGTHPEIAQRAAEESEEQLRKMFKDASLVFLIAGEGGGSGTGCSPVVARIAKEQGAIVIAMVTRPFGFEGKVVMERAIKGINSLRAEVDAIEVIDNQKCFSMGEANIPAFARFKQIDEFVGNMVSGFVNVTRDTSMMKLDFQDLKMTLEKCQGDLFIGVGDATYEVAEGANAYEVHEQAMMEAIERAISCPLIEDINIQNAKGVIALYRVGDDISFEILQKAQETINEKIDTAKTNIIFGADFGNAELNGKIKVFFIVAGLEANAETNNAPVENTFAKPEIFSKGARIPMFEAMPSTAPSSPSEIITRSELEFLNDINAVSPKFGEAEVISSTPKTEMAASVMPKAKRADTNIYGFPGFKTNAVAEKHNAPSIHGFEPVPEFLRTQCQ